MGRRGGWGLCAVLAAAALVVSAVAILAGGGGMCLRGTVGVCVCRSLLSRFPVVVVVVPVSMRVCMRLPRENFGGYQLPKPEPPQRLFRTTA